MNNFFNELKKYFDSTPREKILEDWAKSEEFDKVGPTVEEFLYNSKIYQIRTIDPDTGQNQNILNNFNSEYSSGFFLTKNFIINASGAFNWNTDDTDWTDLH